MSLFTEIHPLNPEKRGIGARTGVIWGVPPGRGHEKNQNEFSRGYFGVLLLPVRDVRARERKKSHQSRNGRTLQHHQAWNFFCPGFSGP
jgi:hypothetical protein